MDLKEYIRLQALLSKYLRCVEDDNIAWPLDSEEQQRLLLTIGQLNSQLLSEIDTLKDFENEQ